MLRRSRPDLQPASFVRSCACAGTSRGPQSRLPPLYKCREPRMRGSNSRHQRSLFTSSYNPITAHTSTTSTTTSLYSRNIQSHTHTRKRSITNMASATSVFDFKPLNSKLHPSHAWFAPATTSIPHHVATAMCPFHASAILPHSHHTLVANSQQRRANPHPSPPTPAKSYSSSTPPPSAASPPNTAVSKRSTRRSKPRTPASSSSSASPATNSAARSPRPTTRSRSSARSTTASPSPSSARRRSTATMPTRCGSTSRARSRG